MTAKIKDMRGVLISEGDVVAYGKSNRDSPINIGVVEGFRYVNAFQCGYDYEILIKGNGNSKVSRIPEWHSNRIIVLPSQYGEQN